MTKMVWGIGNRRWVPLGLAMALGLMAGIAPSGLAETMDAETTNREAERSLCPAPALSRLVRHRVASGETLESIAQSYGLLAATLIGLNPAVQSGRVTVGQELLIPPYNGIRVSVAAGQTWQQVAEIYSTRADVLFEVNGCVRHVPTAIFVPGVNWFPGVQTVATPRADAAPRQTPLQGYPLAQRAEMIMNYGWQPDPNQNRTVFNTGVALATAAAAPVLAVGPGTVAFVGTDAVYGNLVVINHAQGLQTRYAHLDPVNLRVGQTVRQGDRIGQVAAVPNQDSSFLFFEVRLNSEMGWVAQNPRDHVPAMAIR